MYDLDENGQLDRDELKRVLDAMLVLLNVDENNGPGSRDAVVDECLRILDTNKDGQISKGKLFI